MQAQTLHLHLTVLSPLHMGCGEVYEPTSFVVKHKEETLVSFNALHFLAGLDGELLENFSAICKKGNVASLLDVYKFIDEHAQDMEGQAVKLTPALVHHYEKVLGPGGDTIKKKLNQFLLARTAFSPLDGGVYIPGSAVKGAIRTAVLNLRHSKGKLPKQQNAGKMEKELLGMEQGDNFEASPFSRLKVSDFHPVSAVGRRIVYAVDKKKKPNKYETSAPYQIVEIIEPGAVFAGAVSLLPPEDSRVPPEKALTLEEVQSALQTFYRGEFEREKGEASATLSARYPDLPNDALPLRIGRHSGAESVTVEGQRDIKILKGKGNPPEYLNHATTIWFAAEDKDGKGALRPFGWAALRAVGPEEMAKDEAFIREQEERNREERAAAHARREERMAALLKAEEEKKAAEEERQRQEAERKAAEEAERQRAEAERKRKEAEEKAEQERLAKEAEQFPWKPWLRAVEAVVEWQALENLVLKNGDAPRWLKEEGALQAVQNAMQRVRKAFPVAWKKKGRAEICEKWLAENK